MIEALQEARKGGYLNGKLVVNALARPDRKYRRDEDETDGSRIRPASPVPELFADGLPDGEKKRRYVPDEIDPMEAGKRRL